LIHIYRVLSAGTAATTESIGPGNHGHFFRGFFFTAEHKNSSLGRIANHWAFKRALARSQKQRGTRPSFAAWNIFT
jgi:hypothetical protein